MIPIDDGNANQNGENNDDIVHETKKTKTMLRDEVGREDEVRSAGNHKGSDAYCQGSTSPPCNDTMKRSAQQ